MIFLCLEIDHPALFQEKEDPEASNIRAAQFFRVEEILHAHGVHWMKRTPRGLLSLFREGDAAKAALALMRDFQSFQWGHFGKAQLRIALHSGEADASGQDYVGPDLVHCRKVLEAAAPGSILLTVPAVHFVPLPPGARIQDMGTHFLKDLSEPRSLLALAHPDLPGETAPPRSLFQYPQNLGPQGSPFFGREEEMAGIEGLLSDGQVRLVTLVGPGGFGKTRLALQSSADLIEEFEDGVFFIPLAPLLSDQLIVGAIATAVKFLFYGVEEPRAQLMNHLRDKRMLLVLDNFEHLIEGKDLVEELLREAPGVKMLVTSRERLGLEGEKVLEVRGLLYPRDGETAGWEASPAVQLFLRSAHRVHPGFSLKEEDRTPLLRICSLLEGMPLGLELSATWVATLSLAQVAEKIESSRDFLATAMPHLPPRHRSLRAVFEYSWILLDEEQKKVLRSISVFRNSFSEQAARKVAGATEGLLIRLAHKSLLRIRPSGRFEIHELLKFYAKEKLFDEPGEKERVLEAYAGYFGEFLRKRSPELYGKGEKRVLADIAEEMANIREGWRWAVGSGREDLLEAYAQGLFNFYEIQGLFQEALEAFRSALERVEEGSRGPKPSKATRILSAKLRSFIAFHRNVLGEGEEARRDYQKSLEELGTGGAWKERGFAHSGLGILLDGRGEVREARAHFEKARQAYQKAKDRWGLVWALNNLGHIESRSGHRDRALVHLQKALAYGIADKDARSKAYSRNLMGNLFHHSGRFQEAKAQFQEGLANYLETGERRGVAWSFASLGLESFWLGDLKGARQMFLEGLAIYRELGDLRAMGWVKNCLGQSAWASGDHAGAWRYFSEALEHYRKMGDKEGAAWTLDWMGNVRVDQGRLEEARELYRQGAELLGPSAQEGIGAGWARYHEAVLRLAEGDRTGAKKDFEGALAVFEGLEEPIGSIISRVQLGKLLARDREFPTARRLLRRALRPALERNLMPLVAEGLAAVALLHHFEGKDPQALALLLLAFNHPTCRQPTRDDNAKFFQELSARFPEEEVESAQRWALASSLERVAADWALDPGPEGKAARAPSVRKRKTRVRPRGRKAGRRKK